MCEGLPELQFSHTKLGFTSDLRKPPYEETPPPPQKKDNEKKPLPASIGTDLNGFFCVKGTSSKAEERQHGLGRGAEWFAFVSSAGISTGHKFSRGLFGTGQ